MPRAPRASEGGICYHVINRGNGRRTVFRKDADYEAFLKAMGHACIEIPMRVLAYCLMPNHFHLVVWPRHAVWRGVLDGANGQAAGAGVHAAAARPAAEAAGGADTINVPVPFFNSQGQLYHLGDDPGEQKNLWLDKPMVVKELTALLEKYQAEGRSRGK